MAEKKTLALSAREYSLKNRLVFFFNHEFNLKFFDLHSLYSD